MSEKVDETSVSLLLFPNVAVLWLSLLLLLFCIRNSPSSELSPATGYAVFSWLYSVLPGRHKYSSFNYVATASFGFTFNTFFCNHPRISRCYDLRYLQHR
jgi:hypothetical protein